MVDAANATSTKAPRVLEQEHEFRRCLALSLRCDKKSLRHHAGLYSLAYLHGQTSIISGRVCALPDLQFLYADVCKKGTVASFLCAALRVQCAKFTSHVMMERRALPTLTTHEICSNWSS